MADFQWREKLRKTQESTKQVSLVPEQAKSLGFGCFTIGMIIMCLFFAVIGIGLFAQSNLLFGTVSIIISLGIGYMTFQLIRAEKIP
ncbi:hypothetical protein [Paenisporosarcina sp. TG20]|uniref:hypothetical protein n=1 Tax=Paenisporosarcina sp. TG20 TaxID=1211706 RepID=UPI0002F7D8E5|nr:hypothetical protein [Paenisporosarcina sp. TG20]